MLTTYIHLTYDLHKRKHEMYSCVATNCAGDELRDTNCPRIARLRSASTNDTSKTHVLLRNPYMKKPRELGST